METSSNTQAKKEWFGSLSSKIISILLALGIIGGSLYYAVQFLPQSSSSFVPVAAAYNLNQKLTAGSDVTFRFPSEMDKSSVEEALIIPKELEGDLHWADDKTLVLTPKEETEEDTLHRVILQRTAKQKNGKPVGQDLTYRLEIAGAPVVSMRMPTPDSTDVPTDAQITIMFDRPLKPLAAVQGDDSIFTPENFNISLEPEVNGKWRWIGTSAISFDPEDDLDLATKYTVNIPKGLEVMTGDKTEKDFSYSFETIRPKVVYSDPRSGSKSAGPSTKITVGFNQKIDKNSVKKHLGLSEEMFSSVEYVEYENENGEKTTDQKQVVLTPKKPFKFEENYSFILGEGIKGLEGNLGTSSDYTLSFSTVGELSILDAYYDYGDIYINFSNPINDETIKENLEISPKLDGWEDKELSTSSWNDNHTLRIYDNYKPGTKYTVTIKKDLEDKYSQKLGQDYTFDFITPDLDPNVYVHSKGDFGVFERSKTPIFYLNALNVSELKTEYARLTFDHFLNIKKSEEDNYDYEPDLSRFIDHRVYTDKPNADKNEWDIIEFDPAERLGKDLSPGIYAIKVTAPEWGWTNWQGDWIKANSYQYFSVTDIALTLKYSGDKALVWAVNMQTGEPIADANITFYALDREAKIIGKTDTEGFFETNLNLDDFADYEGEYEPEFYVTVNKGEDFAFISNRWSSGLNPWNFGMSSNFLGGNSNGKYRVNSYTYPERQIYKPGDKVYLKGIVRFIDRNGETVTPDENYSAEVTVTDPDWNEIIKETITLNEFGSWSLEVPTGADAMLGYYDVNVNITPDHEIRNNYGGSSFRLAEYRKPEYLVNVESESDDYFDDDTLKFNIEGNYFFGAPLSAAELTWRAKSTDYFFNRYKGDKWYSFALEDAWCWYDCERNEGLLADGEGKLDKDGKSSVELQADISEKSVSQIVTLEADVSDPNNQLVSGRTSVPVHKANLYVGISPDRYVVSPNVESKINLITLNTDGSPKANQSVKLKVFKRTWNTIRKKGVDGEYYYENEVEDELLSEKDVRTDDDGEIQTNITVPEGGSFRVVATAKDDRGRETSAGTSLYAWSDTYVNFSQPNDDKIKIIADKKEYKVGDTAKLLVQSPYQGENVKMMIALERENVISYEVRDLSVNAETIEIPITEELIPNAYVSVVIVKPRQGETFNKNGLDTGMPAFKIGYINLAIDTESKKLSVNLSTDKDRYLPGEEVELSLDVKDSTGRGVKSESSVAVIDLSLLALTGFSLPDLVDNFYAERGLGVYTRQSLVYLMERFKPGSKGGGGGDAGDDTRGEFKDTAYYNPSVITDENGKASVKFTLPDNLTTWKAYAIAHTADSRFGAGEVEFLETKNVILRPVRPRFAVGGDEIKLGAIVHNYTNKRREFKVSLEGTGFEYMSDAEKKVTIDPDSSEKVIFPIKVDLINPRNQKEDLTLHFTAESSINYRDSIKETIPVYAFGTPQTVTTAGSTDTETIEHILIPSEEDAPVGDIKLNISPTVATYLTDGLDYLAQFPYGCAEQTASSLLPNIVASRMNGFEAFRIWGEEELKTNITEGFAKLYDFQKGDGGFGYWKNSRYSSTYLTAYIVYVFNEAAESGYHVDEKVTERAVSYLKSELRKDNNEEIYISLARRAYILYVLSEVDEADESLLNNLYAQRIKLPIFSQAELALSFANIGKDDKAKEITDDLMKYAKVDPRGTHFSESKEQNYRMFMQDEVRTTATVLMALLQTDPENEINSKIARFLINTRKDGYWSTTQATMTSLLALIDYLEATGEMDGDYTAKAEIAGNQVLEKEFNKENILTRAEVITALEELPRGETVGMKITKEGEGKLYYDLMMSYFYAAEEISPVEEGMGIMRNVEGLRGSDPNNIEAGESYQVKLTMTVPASRYNVAVESPLPAGFELVDSSFQTTSRISYEEDTSSQNYWSSGLWRFSHKELRDDRLFMFAEYLPAGVYEYTYIVRATTPGKFRLRPARIWEMYTPENFGQSWGGWFEVKE